MQILGSKTHTYSFMLFGSPQLAGITSDIGRRIQSGFTTSDGSLFASRELRKSVVVVFNLN